MLVDFLLPITKMGITSGPKIETVAVHIGDLAIKANVICGAEPELDYESIKWFPKDTTNLKDPSKGIDILHLLDNMDGVDDAMDKIYMAAVEHAKYRLENAHS